MSKRHYFVMAILLSMTFSSAIASDASDIINILEETYGVDVNMQTIQTELQGLSEKQLDAIIGTNNYGSLGNSNQDLTEREWSPESWDDALKGLSGGNEERYQELVKSYQEAHPSLSSEEASQGLSAPYATDYQQRVKTNQAANVQASYAFDDTNEHLKNIKEISDEIDKTDNTKKIQDLNARLNTEIAYLQVEVIKGIAVMNQQMAQQQASQIVDQTAASKFNTIPE